MLAIFLKIKDEYFMLHVRLVARTIENLNIPFTADPQIKLFQINNLTFFVH